MKSLKTFAVCFFGLLIATLVFASHHEMEEEISIDQLPSAVRKTLEREVFDGKILEIEKETRNGEVIYEADITLDGKKYEIEIASDGTLIKKELEDHQFEQEGQVWTFENSAVGSVPKGWKALETAGKGKPAIWKVIEDEKAPSGKRILALTSTNNSGRTYNLLMAERSNYKNLKIKMKIKAIAGEEDQGGGPIWRAKDRNNYYIARWNPLEDNYRVYYVKNGNRKQLASAKVKIDPKAWHEIKIEHVGNKIKAMLNGKKILEVKDDTFMEAGMVGLWTKADAATAFDDIKVKGDDDDKEDD